MFLHIKNHSQVQWNDLKWCDWTMKKSVVVTALSRCFIPRSILLPPWNQKNYPLNIHGWKMIHLVSKWSQKSGHIRWFSGWVSLYFVLRPAENLDPSCPAWRLARAPWRLVCVTSLRSKWMRIAGPTKNSRVVCCSKRVEANRDNRDLKRISSNVIAFFSSELQTFTYI